MAKAFNMDRSTISLYEMGKTEPPYETMVQFAKYFNVDPNYFFEWTSISHGEMTEERFLKLLEFHGKMLYRDIIKG